METLTGTSVQDFTGNPRSFQVYAVALKTHFTIFTVFKPIKMCLSTTNKKVNSGHLCVFHELTFDQGMVLGYIHF